MGDTVIQYLLHALKLCFIFEDEQLVPCICYLSLNNYDYNCIGSYDWESSKQVSKI